MSMELLIYDRLGYFQQMVIFMFFPSCKPLPEHMAIAQNNHLGNQAYFLLLSNSLICVSLSMFTHPLKFSKISHGCANFMCGTFIHLFHHYLNDQFYESKLILILILGLDRFLNSDTTVLQEPTFQGIFL